MIQEDMDDGMNEIDQIEHEPDKWKSYWDDISGEKLDAELTKEARKEEIRGVHQMKVYDKVPMEMCLKETGKRPIGTRLVDTNTGDKDKPKIRSRLVAQEYRSSQIQAIFAGTPPLESLRALMSIVASSGDGRGMECGKDMYSTMVIDIKRAHFHAKAIRDVYVELPEQDSAPGMRAHFLKSMYGIRDAAQNWEREYTRALVGLGFLSGLATPCIFYHPKRDVRVVVHGDDFTALASGLGGNWLSEQLKKSYQVKVRGILGPDSHDDRCIRILNRVVTWEDDGLVYEPDQRHSELIVKQLGLGESTKALSTPGEKNRMTDESDLAVFVDGDIRSYRSMTMRASYLAQDRPDITFAAKELARSMQAPTVGDWRALKRLGRYLIGRPRVVLRFERQHMPTRFDCSVDTDWAGCVRTRRSTNGGALLLGRHLIETWSTTQAVTALSSGEAEFYGIVKGGSVLLGMMSLMSDMGLKIHGTVWTDSTTGKGIASRRGLGKVRHINTSFLWVQERVATNDFLLAKVKGEENVADLMTKHLDSKTSDRHMESLGILSMAGRSTQQLHVAS